MAYIRTSIVDGVGMVVLNHPQRRNALNRDLVGELIAAITAIEADPAARAILITGAGTAFCAGADLNVLQGAGERELRDVYEGFLRVGRAGLPTLAAVNGPAVGAGMNLALACDLRLAGESARFDARFLRLGLHPGGGHTWMLRRAVGPSAASAILLFGEVLDGPGAVAAGLAWRCLPDAELLPAAIQLAARLATVPRELVVRTKATLAAMATVAEHAEAVEIELGHQLWSMAGSRFGAGGHDNAN